MIGRFHTIFFAVTIALSALTARADEPPTVERLITRLGDADWSVREEATYALLEHEGVDDTVLAAALRAARSGEQRQRLTRIALHRFYSQDGRDQAGRDQAGEVPTGEANGPALGVDLGVPNTQVVQPYQHPMLQAENCPAFLVTHTMPGFPAFSRLRPGDMIVSVGDKPFTADLTVTEFTDRIKGNPAKEIPYNHPGDEIKLRVLRKGSFIDVTLIADSMGRLKAVYPHDKPRGIQWAMTQPAFAAYLAKLTAGVEPTPKIVIQSPADPSGAERPADAPSGS